MKKRGSTVKVSPDEEWRVESDLQTLVEAEKIKGDEKRYAKVQALAKRKMLDVAKVASDED